MRSIIALLLASTVAACAPAVRANPSPSQAPESSDGEQASYSSITDGAVTETGIFTVHQRDGKLFYEIPQAQLEKPFLWVTQIAKAQEGTGYGGTSVGELVVKWERNGDNILLRQETYGLMAPDSISAAYGVGAATFPLVVASFPIETTSPSGAPVIDVTELFTEEVREISPRGRLGNVRSLDADRSFLERVAVFPENIEVEATLTFEMNQSADTPRWERPPPTISALVHHSMVKLPDDPMMPRLADDRVGFFTVNQRDYSLWNSVENNTRFAVTYITKWRLEKKDPSAAVSEPVKPIVYYLGREIPDQYREDIKRGIESWQPAFEAAGFRNAIIAKDAPSVEEDPDWSAEDARISSIRWYPTEDTNAMGPHVHDPRTGEILESDIIMHGGLLDRYRAMYVVQVGADQGVVGGELPDSIKSEVIRSVIAHEVGHALGLQHNMSASSAYPVDSLRSGTFTRKNSVSPSIMDYTRFNYVAQPGDGALRVRILGPYDYFAIKWGYTPIPGAETAQEELPTLNDWAAETATNSWIAFSSDQDNAKRLTEDLGDDAVKATTYGLQNISRSFDALKEAMAVPGDNFANLEYMYLQLLLQRDRMFNHVANVIGGSYWESLTYGQQGTVYRPIPQAKQERALEFLDEAALSEPVEMSDAATLRMFDPFGGAQEIMERQGRLVGNLLDPERLAQMSALAATAQPGESVYSHVEYLSDLRGLLFANLRNPSVSVDAYRRNVQRAVVTNAAESLADPEVSGEAKAVLRATLVDIREMADDARPRSADAATGAHLDYLSAYVDSALEAE
ncbi:MAG TPA: zinc-dependent metalloprotease [Longimicrobiaceae bacterium]|nr:zinc-dependent metalloprotease [Longimicrobiaceae bacterium]